MKAEERIAVLHARMEARQRAKERRRKWATGALCISAAVCLFLLLSGGRAGNTGGYILAAGIAIMAGGVITVLLNSRQGKNVRSKPEKTIKRGPERISFLQDDALMAAAGGKNEDPEEEKKTDQHITRGMV